MDVLKNTAGVPRYTSSVPDPFLFSSFLFPSSFLPLPFLFPLLRKDPPPRCIRLDRIVRRNDRREQPAAVRACVRRPPRGGEGRNLAGFFFSPSSASFPERNYLTVFYSVFYSVFYYSPPRPTVVSGIFCIGESGWVRSGCRGVGCPSSAGARPRSIFRPSTVFPLTAHPQLTPLPVP